MTVKLSRRSVLARLGLAGAGATSGALATGALGAAPAGAAAAAGDGPPARLGLRPDVDPARTAAVVVAASHTATIDPYGMKASGAWTATDIGTVYMTNPSDGSGTFWHSLTLPPGAVATTLSAWGSSGVVVDLLSSTVDGSNYPGLSGPTRQLASADLTNGTAVTGVTGIRGITVAAEVMPFTGGTRTYLVQVRNTKPGQGIQSVAVGYEMPRTSLLAAPVRVYDSRTEIAGRLTSGNERTITTVAPLTGSTFLDPAVPAAAVIMTVTLADTAGSGFLTAYAADVTAPLASNLNWYGSGQIVANTLITRLSSARTLKLRVGGGGSAHVVLDVLGFVY